MDGPTAGSGFWEHDPENFQPSIKQTKKNDLSMIEICTLHWGQTSHEETGRQIFPLAGKLLTLFQARVIYIDERECTTSLQTGKEDKRELWTPCGQWILLLLSSPVPRIVHLSSRLDHNPWHQNQVSKRLPSEARSHWLRSRSDGLESLAGPQPMKNACGTNVLNRLNYQQQQEAVLQMPGMAIQDLEMEHPIIPDNYQICDTIGCKGSYSVAAPNSRVTRAQFKPKCDCPVAIESLVCSPQCSNESPHCPAISFSNGKHCCQWERGEEWSMCQALSTGITSH